MPDMKLSELDALIKRSAYTSFIGDACSISNTVSDQVKKIVSLVFLDQATQQEKLQYFRLHKSNFANDANSLSIFKKCNIDGGKTKVLVSQVGAELDDFYQVRFSVLEYYKNQYMRWEYEVQQEQAEKERVERERVAAQKAAKEESIKSSARTLANQLGKLVVANQYQGGSSVGISLISYEYYESTKTMRLNVEMRWNGSISGESGYAADGEIVAVYDNAREWVIGKNFSWSPKYQSSKLDEWIQQRQFMRAFNSLAQ